MNIQRQVFDKIIDLELRYATREKQERVVRIPYKEEIRGPKVYTIKCPRHGKKPLIAFSYKRVPGNVVYQCDITVTNLYMQLNSIDVDEIIVTAGYSSDNGMHTESFQCQVFNSFTPEPGPDGVTVFQCIIATASMDMMKDRMYNFQVLNNPKNFTCREVWDKICSELQYSDRRGEKVVSNTFVQDWFETEPFTAKDIKATTYTTGYALLSAFVVNLNDVVGRVHKGHTVELGIFSNTLVLIEKDEMGRVVQAPGTVTRDVPVLDLVTSVDWNAGVLSVTAPWSPHIKPDTIFKITPNYYKGSYALPNEIARNQAQRDNQDLYSVITQEVHFSTGQDNSMTIMAVPAMYTDDDKYQETQQQSAKERYENFQNEQKAVITPIHLGEQSKEEEATENAAVDIKGLKLNIAITHYEVQPNDNLSTIASKPELKFPSLKAKRGNNEIERQASYLWFPVIMACTNAHKGEGKYKINMESPELIYPGDWLALPQQASWYSLWTQAKNDIIKVYRTVADFYINTEKASYAVAFNEVANIFENWTVVQ